eukprot:GFUD01044548.1.p1 GENE.GFUD01044548.1~~GFUD01044548.1.p1  ORF type:complete len:191 (-),score=51.84 GFUD01044548.1:65-637(-)
MCIVFHPSMNEISEKELEAAYQAAVDHDNEEEEEGYLSDEECICDSDEELICLLIVMSTLREDETYWGEIWSQLCDIKKQEVWDIILKLANEVETLSENGMEALALALEGKSDGKVNCFDHDEMKHLKLLLLNIILNLKYEILTEVVSEKDKEAIAVALAHVKTIFEGKSEHFEFDGEGCVCEASEKSTA